MTEPWSGAATPSVAPDCGRFADRTQTAEALQTRVAMLAIRPSRMHPEFQTREVAIE